MRLPNINNLEQIGQIVGIVLTVLAVVGGIVGGVVGSGALNDDKGSSRGASASVISPQPTQPSDTQTAPEQPGPGLSPEAQAAADRFAELARQAEESIRRQEELLKQMQ